MKIIVRLCAVERILYTCLTPYMYSVRFCTCISPMQCDTNVLGFMLPLWITSSPPGEESFYLSITWFGRDARSWRPAHRNHFLTSQNPKNRFPSYYSVQQFECLNLTSYYKSSHSGACVFHSTALSIMATDVGPKITIKTKTFYSTTKSCYS